jgi:hypothetical protein
MRTLILLAAGLSLAAISVLLTKPERRRMARLIFCNAWLIVMILNLRAGLAHGYTLGQELPIHLLLFALPAGLAIWLARDAPARSE